MRRLSQAVDSVVSWYGDGHDWKEKFEDANARRAIEALIENRGALIKTVDALDYSIITNLPETVWASLIDQGRGEGLLEELRRLRDTSAMRGKTAEEVRRLQRTISKLSELLKAQGP